MLDARELRSKRLGNEHRELMKINGPIIQIVPLGSEPYGSYRITFNIRTIISPLPAYRDRTVCTLIIPARYPMDQPKLAVDDMAPPWHVNWFRGGTWCHGHWSPEESLVNYIYRCAKTLQFDPEITNPDSPANREAMPFWDENKRNRRIIPCDTQKLPTVDGETLRIVIKPRA